MEKRYIRCTWANILYLAQGFVLAGIGVAGVVMFKRYGEECVRARGIYIVLLLHACFQLISTVIYIKCNFKFRMSRIFTAYFLWGCMIGCLATYQAVLSYEYKQAITFHVFTNILTGLLVLLVSILKIN
ncbi:uncharacterized protein LOC132755862 [Ruditapes philippinarum]|uniref:uncharacterized protein LOC132755862 n=1 Tax=Ruditapes philippinarum TaxID=129788 RepID=UPI00295A8566|nr:uncharacterized protein LOC132755862 [Ruditapes philippinarum]